MTIHSPSFWRTVMSLNTSMSQPSGVKGAMANHSALPEITASAHTSAREISHEAAWMEEMRFVFDQILRFGLSPADLATPGPRFPVVEHAAASRSAFGRV